jgi:hypothetical protein
MNAVTARRVSFVVCSLVVTGLPLRGLAGESSDASSANVQQARKQRDGQRDFDFEIGTWKTHLSRLVRPLTGSTTWVEYDGISVVRKIWNGRANLVELEANGPAGRITALSLRLYNPESRQWSLHFSNVESGTLSPPSIGEFKNGRGEFFAQETLNGRAILVRFVISDITPNSCRFEQSFSDDGGKTWERNWIAVDTRVTEKPARPRRTAGLMRGVRHRPRRLRRVRCALRGPHLAQAQGRPGDPAQDLAVGRCGTATGEWIFNLGTKAFSAPGTYTISVDSGSSAYEIDPSCTGVFVRQ